jgi:hypothetical protein
MHDQRYIHDREIEDFLNETLHTSKTRQIDLEEGTTLWRAQLGGNEGKDGELAQHPPERMYPPRYIATEGRANPKGIPCLYLATDKETAMGEVRPWVGSELSIAQFKVLKHLKLIDCSLNHSSGNPLYFNVETADFYEPNEIEREKAVWTYIDKAFSEPIIVNENQAHYAPTQIIAELFKRNGANGMVYKSLLGKGFNIALFDINTANLINCNLFRTESISFKFVQAGNPYFVCEK